MRESVIRAAAEKARLAARLGVTTDATGRRLSGQLDPEFDALHQRLVELEDQILDLGLPPTQLQVKWFQGACARLEQVQPLLRQARRELQAA